MNAPEVAFRCARKECGPNLRPRPLKDRLFSSLSARETPEIWRKTGRGLIGAFVVNYNFVGGNSETQISRYRAIKTFIIAGFVEEEVSYRY